MKSTCSRQSSFAKRGFSLIEVAVALAIFVFGALAIVRIFPGALGVIQNSESRAIATRAAQATVSELSAQPELVPDAIFDTDPASTNWQNWHDFPSSVSGTRSKPRGTGLFTSLPGGPPSSRDLDPTATTFSSIKNSALGQFRRIQGEKQKVRRLGSNTTDPLYVLTRHPYENLSVYREYQVEDVRLETDSTGVQGRLDFSDARAVPSNALFTPFSQNAPTPSDPMRPHSNLRSDATKTVPFYVSYRWIENGQTRSVQDEPILFPTDLGTPSWDSNNSGRVRHSFHTSTITVEEGSVEMWFRYPLTLGSAPGADDQIRGYIALDGLGLSEGDEVSLDYDVIDWRWIVEDSTPNKFPSPMPPDTPGVTPRAVILPTRYINDDPMAEVNFTPNFPKPLYSLLFSESNAARTISDWGQDSGVTGTDLINVAAKRGQVTFDVAGFTSPRARVVYRGLDGWAKQLSVAARSYMPMISSSFLSASYPAAEHPREGWREYGWAEFMTSSTVPDSEHDCLYFHPSEAGKTVSVSFSYSDGTRTHNINNTLITLDDDIIDAPTWLATEFGPKVVRAELATLSGRILAEDTSLTLVSIREVRGASVRSRVAWLDGGQYSQAAISGYRLAN